MGRLDQPMALRQRPGLLWVLLRFTVIAGLAMAFGSLLIGAIVVATAR